MIECFVGLLFVALIVATNFLFYRLGEHNAKEQQTKELLEVISKTRKAHASLGDSSVVDKLHKKYSR